jgi:glycosyltransferase involved in cell wall biosynthesis
MRVLFLSGRETTYPRNDVLLRAFRRFGEVDVVSTSTQKATLRRSLILPLRAARKLRSGDFDLVFVGFYGHLMMLPVSWLARPPILFDAFISTYDTLAGDRRRVSPGSLAGRLAFQMDRAACRRADHVLIDTPQQREFFIRNFRIPDSAISALPVGCNEEIFRPLRVREKPTVLYYSSYQPLHGVETVIQAADRLYDTELTFRLIGAGQTYPAARDLAAQLRLKHVEFLDPVALEALPPEIASSAICLGGHFGESEKAGRVIPGKIYQLLAMGRPVIAADTPANRSLLVHGESAYLVPPGDPAALADAIRKLDNDPATRQHIAQGGRKAYERAASEKAITQQLQALATVVVKR